MPCRWDLTQGYCDVDYYCVPSGGWGGLAFGGHSQTLEPPQIHQGRDVKTQVSSSGAALSPFPSRFFFLCLFLFSPLQPQSLSSSIVAGEVIWKSVGSQVVWIS